MRAPLIKLTLASMSAGLWVASAAPATAPVTDPATRAKVTAGYLQSPMIFEMNEGQSDPQVKALARGSRYGLFLTSNESVFVVDPGAKNQAVVRVRNIGANPAPRVSGLDRLDSTSNYYVGRDESKWRKNVANYARVKYDSIYPGIDLIYYGNQQQFEYDYVVAPGADPNSIRLAIDGARKLHIDPNGDLLMETGHGAIHQHKPVIYQEVDGVRREIAGNFIVDGNRVSFQVGDYDHSNKLVIDPSFLFKSYLGGSGTDQGLAITVTTGLGVTIVAGSTSSANFPIVPMSGVISFPYTGETDGFIAVIYYNTSTTDTHLLNSTFVGGTGGVNVINSIAVDNSENPVLMYVAGYTTSPNLSVKNAAQPTLGGKTDGWLAQVNLNVNITSFPPNLQYTVTTTLGFVTYLGGSGTDEITGITMDQNSKDVFVTGFTGSTNFKVTSGVVQKTNAGGEDAFVARFASGLSPETTPAGTLLFSTYLGGTGTDAGSGIAVCTSNPTPTAPNPPTVCTNTKAGALTIYISGTTTSSALPATTGTPDTAPASTGFLVAMSGHGTSTYFTKLIGSSTKTTKANAVITDIAGTIYITGNTNDPALPVVKPVQTFYKGGGNDAFVAAYGAGGTASFLSYFGGAGADIANTIGVFLTPNSDSTTSINLFIAGSTTGGLPIVNATGLQPIYGGGSSDGFVAMFSTSHGSSFTKAYSTYVGGPGTDVIYSLFVGSSGNARFTGITNSTTGIATPGVFQAGIGGGFDAFVAAIQTTP